jgi:predicted dehydrogenase
MSSSEIRLAIIGCGRILPAHLRGLRTLRDAGFEGFRVTALLARKLDDALMFRRRGEGPEPRPPASVNAGDPLGAPHMYVSDIHDGEVGVYDDLDMMLADAPVDAVVILATHSVHHTIAIKCLKAGKHVAVEKPMAITVLAARRMIEAAEAAGRSLLVLESARYSLGNRAAEWAMQTGLIGDPQMLLSVAVGLREWSPDHVLAHTPWRHDRLSGGGVAVDFGVHLTTWARRVAGEFDEVSALTRVLEPLRREYDDAGNVLSEVTADAEDVFFANATFESGAIGQFSFCAAGHGEGVGLEGGRAVYGTRGCLKGDEAILDDGTRGSLTGIFGDRVDADLRARWFPLGLEDRFALEHHDFLSAISTGVEPEMSGEEGLRDLAAAWAMLESSHAGRPVKVSKVQSGELSACQDELNEHWELT